MCVMPSCTCERVVVPVAAFHSRGKNSMFPRHCMKTLAFFASTIDRDYREIYRSSRTKSPLLSTRVPGSPTKSLAPDELSIAGGRAGGRRRREREEKERKGGTKKIGIIRQKYLFQSDALASTRNSVVDTTDSNWKALSRFYCRISYADLFQGRTNTRFVLDKLTFLC